MNRKGFGELALVVCIVLGLIVVLFAFSIIYPDRPGGASLDSRRMSDLRQIQNMLEMYHDKCGVYPGGNSRSIGCAKSGGVAGTVQANSLISLFAAVGITMMPDDPLQSQHYRYTPGIANSGIGYTLSAKLDDKNNYALSGQQAFQNGVACDAVSQTYCVTL